mgnify:CR=1 FL=1
MNFNFEYTCDENEKITSLRVNGMPYTSYEREKGEILTISEVRPVYTMRTREDGEQTSLLLGFEGMPRTRFRPGMTVRVIVES